MRFWGSLRMVLGLPFALLHQPPIYHFGDMRWMGDTSPADRTPAAEPEPDVWLGEN